MITLYKFNDSLTVYYYIPARYGIFLNYISSLNAYRFDFIPLRNFKSFYSYQ